MHTHSDILIERARDWIADLKLKIDQETHIEGLILHIKNQLRNEVYIRRLEEIAANRAKYIQQRNDLIEMLRVYEIMN